MNRTTKTLFLDIDGTILSHEMFPDLNAKILPGVKEWFENNVDDSVYIVLTTARDEEMREFTEQQLKLNNIPYNQLIMGIGHGIRFLVNDWKDYNCPKCYAVGTERDSGSWCKNPILTEPIYSDGEF